MSLPPPSVSAAEVQRQLDCACRAHEDGHLHEALHAYRQLIAALPAMALLHYNLGLVLYEMARFEQALPAFAQADHLMPEDPDTLFNLALCQRKTGHAAAAIATYLHLLEVEPGHIDGLYNLGGCYLHLHDDGQARDCYQRVLDLDPNYLSALNNLAYLHHRAGEMAEAINLYGRVLEQRPEDESVQYLLAALLEVPLDQAPERYVRDFFDAFAEDFERSLVEDLHYDNPRQLYGCLCRSSVSATERFQHGLDLGCGTGLSGLAFKDHTLLLDGVDLSGAMLAQAQAKGCYHHLYQDSIDHFLRATGERYDLFLATDVFIYVGNLLPIFTAAHDVGRSGSLFCFSTEHLSVPGFRLMPTGRFAYAPRYLHELAQETGWQVMRTEPTRLRREREGWIGGDLWIVQRLGLDG